MNIDDLRALQSPLVRVPRIALHKTRTLKAGQLRGATAEPKSVGQGDRRGAVDDRAGLEGAGADDERGGGDCAEHVCARWVLGWMRICRNLSAR